MSADCIDDLHYPVWERDVLNMGKKKGFHWVMQEKANRKAKACEDHGKDGPVKMCLICITTRKLNSFVLHPGVQ